MSLGDRLRELDNRVIGRAGHLQRKTALRSGIAFGVFPAANYIGSFWDLTFAWNAATAAFFCGLFLGRVQESDFVRAGRGHLRRPDAAVG